jgi:hypothetical protein
MKSYDTIHIITTAFIALLVTYFLIKTLPKKCRIHEQSFNQTAKDHIDYCYREIKKNSFEMKVITILGRDIYNKNEALLSMIKPELTGPFIQLLFLGYNINQAFEAIKIIEKITIFSPLTAESVIESMSYVQQINDIRNLN